MKTLWRYITSTLIVGGGIATIYHVADWLMRPENEEFLLKVCSIVMYILLGLVFAGFVWVVVDWLPKKDSKL
jgi:hypothetical protein